MPRPGRYLTPGLLLFWNKPKLLHQAQSIENSYVHDTQGNGLWCDQGCVDSSSHSKGFWVHDNLVVNNGRAGIRFENVGGSTAGEALIEYNEVHGNSLDDQVEKSAILRPYEGVAMQDCGYGFPRTPYSPTLAK